ncbi:MAG TPA: hypothetical protein VGU27_12535, partial [Candidatus Eisenbacteria bacterium]|nr:hypothetical protein [Candidatus Eisenbacteria bacterium]
MACDACGAGAWVGPRADGFDAWCERCQSPAALAQAPSGDERCPHCRERRHAGLRFPALWGALQDLEGVVAAWAGDP